MFHLQYTLFVSIYLDGAPIQDKAVFETGDEGAQSAESVWAPN